MRKYLHKLIKKIKVILRCVDKYYVSKRSNQDHKQGEAKVKYQIVDTLTSEVLAETTNAKFMNKITIKYQKLGKTILVLLINNQRKSCISIARAA